MANPLKLPFDFPPNTTPPTHMLQANFAALLKFVDDLNTGVQALTNLLVTTLQTTSTATIGGLLTASGAATVAGALTAQSTAVVTGALTANSTATVSGALTAQSTVAATGLVTANNGVTVNNAALTANSTSSLVGAVTAGSTLAATGNITASSDVNFGTSAVRLYRPAANQLAVDTSSTKGWQIDASGNINQAIQPNFLAINSTSRSNVTGDGTTYTVAFNNEIYDQSGSYDNAAFTFTAPVTGRFFLCAMVQMSGVTTTAKTSGQVAIVTSNLTYNGNFFVKENFSQGNVSVIADMDANDTASVTIRISGGSKDVSVDGGASGQTHFSASLIN
jgi:hypothetical protein